MERKAATTYLLKTAHHRKKTILIKITNEVNFEAVSSKYRGAL